MDQELKDDLDHWQLEEAIRLQVDHGHSPSMAWLLASYSRSWIQRSLEQPLPMCIVTGI